MAMSDIRMETKEEKTPMKCEDEEEGFKQGRGIIVVREEGRKGKNGRKF